MVEEDAVAGKKVIGFPVVDRHPVRVKLGDGVGGAGVELGVLALGRADLAAEQFRGGRLVKPRLDPEILDRIQKTQRADRVHLGRVLRYLKGDGHVGLGGQIVNFFRLYASQQAVQVAGIGQVPKISMEIGMVEDVVDPLRGENGASPHDGVNVISLCQQKLGQIGAILAGGACQKRSFGHFFGSLVRWQLYGAETGRLRPWALA